jgi:putative photosynthetic complex assembly protein 2
MALVIGTVVFTILAWWGSTGLIVYAVRSFEAQHGAVIVGATVIAALGVAALVISAGSPSVGGAIAAFTGALLIWAFFETTFLLGWLTGPRRLPLPQGAAGFLRFKLAALTVIHHELALFGALLAMALALYAEPNHVAVMTFALLWVMRLLAKFILFLGARHSLSEMMPERLGYLQTYFRTDRTTWLFPVVLLVGAASVAFLIRTTFLAETPFMVTAQTLAATFLTLALAELIVLNLPLRDSALWGWALPKVRAVKSTHTV